MNAPLTANQVADYLLWFGAEHGDPLSNLKLQKLVYYAQAWHLALFKKPLFSERLEAWVHGPVEPKLYRRFKAYGFGLVPPPNKKPALPARIENHLKEVFSVYGRYSAWDLERMTHAETPWVKARGGIAEDEPCTVPISHSEMQRFYQAMAEAPSLEAC